MKRTAKAIFSKALSAVDPSKILKERIRIERDRLSIKMQGDSEKIFDLKAFHKIVLVGTGKASSSMARAIEEIFGDRMTKGVITTKYGHLLPLKQTEIIEAGHPIPDRKGYEGARKIQRLLKESGPNDLVIFLLSGGGSALLPFPADGIELERKTGGDSTPSRLRSRYQRDQYHSETYLPDERRMACQVGLSFHSHRVHSVRRRGRSTGCHRLRPHCS